MVLIVFVVPHFIAVGFVAGELSSGWSANAHHEAEEKTDAKMKTDMKMEMARNAGARHMRFAFPILYFPSLGLAPMIEQLHRFQCTS